MKEGADGIEYPLDPFELRRVSQALIVERLDTGVQPVRQGVGLEESE